MAKILVIDDDRSLLEFMSVVLHNSGHTVFVAHDGREAHEVARRHAVDLVITDILMPEADGLSVISNLKKTLPNVRVVAVSGGSSLVPVDYSLAIAAMFGAPLTLRKPFRAADLGALVDRALQ